MVDLRLDVKMKSLRDWCRTESHGGNSCKALAGNGRSKLIGTFLNPYTDRKKSRAPGVTLTMTSVIWRHMR